MIVNPQFYNYRLEFIEQEKSLVVNELSEMITQYEVVDLQNQDISQQLVISKDKINRVLDSVRRLKPNASLVSHYKAQLSELQLEKKQVLTYANDLKTKNESLKEKTELFQGKIEETNLSTENLVAQNTSLSQSNLELKENLELAKQLTITNLNALAVKKATSRKIEKGNKDIYIQILSPKSNVLADKESINFGEESLIYSKKETINFVNQDLNISTLIKIENNTKLVEGIYFISVFHDAKHIGGTSIELK